jgi:hypothetical protein
MLFLALVLFPGKLLAGSATLTWQANSETDLAGYQVYYGTSSRSYGLPVPVGKVTTYQLSGLQEGRTYYFAVTAVDTSGNESGYSTEVSLNVSGLPAAPVLVSPSEGATQAATAVTFTWNASPGATDYDLAVWNASGVIFDKWIGNVTSYQVSGLPNGGTKYYWIVYPKNAAGVGPHSEIRSFVNGTVSQSPPPAPILVSPSEGASQAATSVTFTWNASPGATDYDLAVYNASGILFDKWIGNVTSYQVNGLPNDGTRFYWIVYPRNAAGVGPHSEIRSFVNGASSS